MSPQQTIAHYRITAKLGEGGMGEVWRATDTKLGRDVAIKIVPEALAQDDDRMARFEREAHVLASLNHPNIASIYGVENNAIVMELVEGNELRGPMPLDQALPIINQLIDALEYAHDKGVIHRDLKPANIKITPEGRVKVLDMGLAVAQSSGVASGDPKSSPTLTIRASEVGMIMGTAAYMSPEQARGQNVDRRADIWSFGVVVWELLTGRQMFEGATVSDTLAAVLTKEPDLAAIPARLRPILERCLRKDVRRRWQAIGDARIALEEGVPAALTPDRGQSKLSWIITGALALALIVTVFLLWPSSPPATRPLLRFTDDLGTGSNGDLRTEPDGDPALARHIAISPDGTRLAFLAANRRLFVRFLDNPKPVALAGTEGATRPFFSPDGAWIGFFAAGKLKKIAVHGGAPVTICETVNMLGASWAENGNIIFAPNNRGGLVRVSAEGGSPEPVTNLDVKKGESTQRFPQILPGGKAVLFTTGTPGDYEDADIVVQVLKTGQRKTLYHGGYHGRYVTSGHLIYMHQGTLFAAPMDAQSLTLTGTSTPILDDVGAYPFSADIALDVSASGTLAYFPAMTNTQLLTLAWIDASGKTERMSTPARQYVAPVAMSPDGTRLAVVVQESFFRNLWIYDLGRDRLFPITFGKGNLSFGAWSPDGNHMVFSSTTGGTGIYWVRADGASQPQRLVDLSTVGTNSKMSFSPDGKRLAFFSSAAIQTVALDLSDPEHPRAGKPEPFSTGPGRPTSPAFSPDGRWMAYSSDELGRNEVYVAPFPGPGGKWLVSNTGGLPVWSHNGRELFYESGNGHIMVVTYTTHGSSFEADPARLWTDRVLPSSTNGLAPDGKRFAVAIPAGDESAQKTPTHVVFLLNFADELKRRAPAK